MNGSLRVGDNLPTVIEKNICKAKCKTKWTRPSHANSAKFAIRMHKKYCIEYTVV
jgi:hypothetical protein